MHKQILIVGSNSILSKQLVSDLESEYLIDIAYSGNNPGIESDANSINLIKLDSVFSSNKKYDFVIIISAFIPANNEGNNKKLYEVNVELVERLISKNKDSKIIFCSTVSVFTPNNNEIISKKSTVNPINEYGISKLWAEKIIQKNAKSYAILRISSLMGVGMKSNTFLPLIIENAIKNKKITLFGEGKRLQNYIDVSILSKMVKKCLKYEKNEVFLAVGEKSFTNKEIAEMVKSKTNCEIVFEGIDNSISIEYDNSFTKKELNIIYEKSIEQSIDELIEWKRKQF
ncbi:MAG: NAD(P)-dependent oxidoreductase [Bacteroidota bacterium]